MNNNNSSNIKKCSFCLSNVDINTWFDYLYVNDVGLYFCDIACCHLYTEFEQIEHL